MQKGESHKSSLLGFRRCSECGVERHEILFRTPHAGFGRCIFCWWSRFALNDMLMEDLDETYRSPLRNDYDISEFGYRPEHGQVRICGRCRSLKEVGVPFAAAQLCSCERGPRQAKWDRYDFNEKIHLCECCDAHVLGSGSKFSVWFCEACKHYVDALNDFHGRTVVPIGRHSFMFRGGLEAGRPAADEGVDVFAGRLHGVLKGMGDLIDILVEHRRGERAARLDGMGLGSGEDVRLSRYLEAFTKAGPSHTSLVAFDRLARHFAETVLR